MIIFFFSLLAKQDSHGPLNTEKRPNCHCSKVLFHLKYPLFQLLDCKHNSIKRIRKFKTLNEFKRNKDNTEIFSFLRYKEKKVTNLAGVNASKIRCREEMRFLYPQVRTRATITAVVQSPSFVTKVVLFQVCMSVYSPREKNFLFSMFPTSD